MDSIHITPSGEVHLRLPHGKEYKRDRIIGHLIGDTFVTDKPENCVMRAYNGSIGFNYEFMRNYRFTNVIVHLSSGRVLRTTRETVLAYGAFLHFKANKLEKQIFLRLTDFARQPEPRPRKSTKSRECPGQGDLFSDQDDRCGYGGRLAS